MIGLPRGAISIRDRMVAGPGPARKATLHAFLRDIANSPVKVSLLTYFWNNVGLMTSTIELARGLQQKPEVVNQAVQELAEAGVLAYAQVFGYVDVCYLDTIHHSPAIRDGIGLLARAMYDDDESVIAWVGGLTADTGLQTLPETSALESRVSDDLRGTS